jgi:hypothetical protein
MFTVTSADGTRIAYDRYGEGPAVILVSGAAGPVSVQHEVDDIAALIDAEGDPMRAASTSCVTASGCLPRSSR